MYRSLGDESISRYSATPVRVRGLQGASALGSGNLVGYAVVPNP